MVTLTVAGSAGVPVMAPLVPSRAKVPGSVLGGTTLQEYGATPRATCTAALYPEPTTPSGSSEVVITSGPGLIVTPYVVTALAPIESVTVTSNEDGPVPVG